MEPLIESDEPEDAWHRAQRTGVLVLSRFVTDDEEWLALIDRWQAACLAERRASIVAFVDGDRDLASVCFDGQGLPSFARGRLDAAMGRLLEETVDDDGFPHGAFAAWRTKCVPTAKASRVAAKARRLDRFARDPAGAREFEDQGAHVAVREVNDL